MLPLNVAITGGIGSGKSVACRIFSTLGIPVYYADIEAKILTSTNTELRTKLIEAFGEQVYSNGELNKTFFAEQIFNDANKRQLANSIIHPAVHQQFATWRSLQKDAPYTLHEAAIVFETGSYRMFDKIITVVAPLDVRIERIMARDNTSKEMILKKINSQWPDEEKMMLSDFVIKNDEMELLLPQILEIHKQLTENAGI